MQHPSGKINVTPLIDVVMVLIIFYLIVGKMAADRRAQIELPFTGVGAAEEGTPLIITIAAAEGVGVGVGAEGATAAAGARMFLNGTEMDRETLENTLIAAGSEAAVQVRADRRLPYGAVAPVVDACRRAGMGSVKLVTERMPGGAGGVGGVGGGT